MTVLSFLDPSRFSFDGSRARGRPIDLFLFIYGEGENDYFGYTNAEQGFTLEGREYVPLAISRDGIKAKGRGKTSELKVDVPANSGIAGLIRGGAPRRVIVLKIYKGHYASAHGSEGITGPAEVGLVWSGRVLEAGRKKNKTVLSCDTLGAGMARPALTVNYQRECGRVLYGAQCKASKAAATSDVVVASVVGTTIGLPAAWHGAWTPSQYIGGVIEWAGTYGAETRMIINAGDESVTTDSFASDLVAAMTAQVVLGCARNMDACSATHSNILNYGGFPFIPLKNPINQNNHT